ncbi:transglutaminase-like cysteine peptidase [Thiomicrospira microaerophila]|uniref:transglutaminase-like cysteine peptidase n=1 Tax=Thiomicrospira microaerophila TaxID=406020 RepID=UPI0005CB6299|nr:transglutaminase-like cysteine peptidase [Thiomicrospira microaerophila]
MQRRGFLVLGAFGLLGSALSFANKAPSMFGERELARARDKYGELAVRRLRAWQVLVDENLSRPERLKLTLVNDFFAQVTLSDSKTVWGLDNYWATPAEFLVKDAGSAVDFVTAKYFTLVALGVAESKLYFTYVTSSRLRRPHVVLTYFRSARSEPLILDSLTDRILPASERADLQPIYSFNAQGAREGERMQAAALDSWNQMLNRMRNGVIN